MATKAKSGTKKTETKKKSPAKKGAEAPEIKPQLSDFVGKKLKDMGYDDENEKVLTIKFENGYNIKVGGNISLKVEKS